MIACEGSKTEPAYFEGIRKSLRLSTVQIKILPHLGTDPLRIVEAAIAGRQDMKVDKAWITGDRAWAVFDGDEHIANNPDNWRSALAKAKSQKIDLAITNPCFEFWYLIHFRDHLAQIDRIKTLALLKQHVSDYEKAACLYPEPLSLLTTQAIQRARKIAEQIQRDQLAPFSNPCCSELPELVESLLKLAT
ncbi:RloB domain-containing protein [Phormidium sp. CLA17]|nr:RloB domain-containing protein [Leptolyngbya sp. Cla-17]